MRLVPCSAYRAAGYEGCHVLGDPGLCHCIDLAALDGGNYMVAFPAGGYGREAAFSGADHLVVSLCPLLVSTEVLGLHFQQAASIQARESGFAGATCI